MMKSLFIPLALVLPFTLAAGQLGTQTTGNSAQDRQTSKDTALDVQENKAVRVYALGGTSEFERGNVEPCNGPLVQDEGFRGTFTMERRFNPQAGAKDFQLKDINWLVDFEGNSLRVTGQGSYQLRQVEGQNTAEMILDLSIGEEPMQRFTSEAQVVPQQAGFPNLALNVSTGQQCFDTRLAIHARPVPEQLMAEYSIDTMNSALLQVCESPCNGETQLLPLQGAFEIIPLGQHQGVNEFAIVNIQWQFEQFAPQYRQRQVRGAGIWQVRADQSAEQRIVLDLTVDHYKRRHESDWTQTSAYPVLDIEAAMGEQSGYDEVVQLVAIPQGN